jgi:hypothetical protein
MTEDAVKCGRLNNTMTVSLFTHIKQNLHFNYEPGTQSHTHTPLSSDLTSTDLIRLSHTAIPTDQITICMICAGNHGGFYSVLTIHCSSHPTMDARTAFVATDRLWSRYTLHERDETSIYPQNVLQSWSAYAEYHITKKVRNSKQVHVWTHWCMHQTHAVNPSQNDLATKTGLVPHFGKHWPINQHFVTQCP